MAQSTQQALKSLTRMELPPEVKIDLVRTLERLVKGEDEESVRKSLEARNYENIKAVVQIGNPPCNRFHEAYYVGFHEIKQVGIIFKKRRSTPFNTAEYCRDCNRSIVTNVARDYYESGIQMERMETLLCRKGYRVARRIEGEVRGYEAVELYSKKLRPKNLRLRSWVDREEIFAPKLLPWNYVEMQVDGSPAVLMQALSHLLQ